MLKKHQPALTIEEQIENLKSIGLIIDDEAYAKRILNDISYFRLIKAYSLGLKPTNGNYKSDVTFEHIVSLYLFNAHLRKIILSEIERIEVNLRCRTANYFCTKYGVLGYKDPANFNNDTYHAEFLNDVATELSRNANAPFVKNFQTNYEGGDLPFYALVELLSFGSLSKFFKNLKNNDKKTISHQFGVGYTYLESWVESISYVRNICAHYGRLYNAFLSKKPILYSQYTTSGISNKYIFAVILCLKHLLHKDSHWISFVEKLETLINSSSEINIRFLGFPENWAAILKEPDTLSKTPQTQKNAS